MATTSFWAAVRATAASRMRAACAVANTMSAFAFCQSVNEVSTSAELNCQASLDRRNQGMAAHPVRSPFLLPGRRLATTVPVTVSDGVVTRVGRTSAVWSLAASGVFGSIRTRNGPATCAGSGPPRSSRGASGLAAGSESK